MKASAADIWQDVSCFGQAITYYRTHRPYFYVFLRPYELFLFHKVASGFQDPVLDFGCGDGFFARFLFAPGRIAYGVDNDPAIVADARQVYQTVLLSDHARIDLPSDSIQTIFSNSVFEHLREPGPMMHELVRILQPGGKMFLTITVQPWEDALWGVRLFGPRYQRWWRKIQRHHSLWSAQAWEKLFQQAGMQVVQKMGYLSGKAVRLVEIYHYLCVPALIIRKMGGRWEYPLNRMLNAMFAHLTCPTMLENALPAINAPCYFFELEKTAQSSL